MNPIIPQTYLRHPRGGTGSGRVPRGSGSSGLDPERRLGELGLVLPPAPRPVASYVPIVRTGSLALVSGQIPILDGTLIATGSVPGQVSLDEAIRCARQCTLNALAVVRAELGSLAGILRVVRVGGFVACEPGFTDQPRVINGASDLLVEVFGSAGRHARAAVGSVALPLDAPVEIEFLFEVDGAAPA